MFKHQRITLLTILMIKIGISGFANQHVILRINDSYAPFEYTNNDGKPIGFTTDVFKAINAINHFDYHMVPDKRIFNFYSTVLDSTELATSMDSIPKDSKFISSDPFGYIDNDIVTRVYSGIESLEDLNGKHVLIVKDSPLIIQFQQRKLNIKFAYIKSVPDGLRLLSSGKYDAMITSNDAAYYYIKRLELSNLSVKTLLCQPLAIRFVMINSPKNKKIIEKINSSLKVIRSNGTYDSIYSRRFFPENRDSISKFELWIIIICSIFFMVLIIYILYIHWIYQAANRKSKKKQIDPSSFETYIKNIYESVPTAVVFYDISGQIQFINSAAEELMNHNKLVTPHLGEHTLFDYSILSSDMIEDLQDNKPIQLIYDLINHENLFNYLGDYPLPHNRIFNIHIVPACNYNSPIHGYFAYIYDITDLRNTNYENLKHITTLSQISDNKLLEISYYDAFDDKFYYIADNEIKSMGMTYEQILPYIHPLSRSIFIDEFLSILNGEKRRARFSINRMIRKDSEYFPCDLILNAIRYDSNTIIGISLLVMPTAENHPIFSKNKELEDKLQLLISSSKYQFVEYNPADDIVSIKTNSGTKKVMSIEDILEHTHQDDIHKIKDALQEIKNKSINKSYLVIRFSPDKSKAYNYYELYLRVMQGDSSGIKVIGVYHNITEQFMLIREFEEFKEFATLACENNNIWFTEYYTEEQDNTLFPIQITSKYGIDDSNITRHLDNESIEAFNNYIAQLNNGQEHINDLTLNITAPITKENILLDINLTPVKNEINGTVYKYLGYIKVLTSR